MKRHVFSMALVAASGIASAQSSVTLFGVMDVALQRGSGSVADRTQVVSGANSTSRLGFRGREDLGGGIAASFWLEAAIAADDGRGGATNTNNQTTGGALAGLNGGQGLTFGRRSTVSLHLPWGEFRFGRDYDAQQRIAVGIDPFSNLGVGIIQPVAGTLGGPVSTRTSNFLGYYLPENAGGFYGFAQYYLGENLSNAGATADDGTGAGVYLGYKSGPLDVSAATAKTQYAKTATTGDITSSNFGVKYQAGPVLVLAGYFMDKVESTAGVTGKGTSVGGIWRVGVGDVKVALSNYKSSSGTRPESKKLSVGYVHNLSKRTALYTTYARVRNSGGATTAVGGAVTAANANSSGFDLGLRHTF